MDAAHSQVVAHLAALAATSEPDKRAAFEAWAPSVHMRTERWAVNPELYDDEDAISAWQGWEAGAAWATGQAVDKTPGMQTRAVDKNVRLQRQVVGCDCGETFPGGPRCDGSCASRYDRGAIQAPEGGPHHCAPHDIAALVARLEALADPEQEAMPSFADTDWRTLSSVCHRVISHLRARVDSLSREAWEWSKALEAQFKVAPAQSPAEGDAPVARVLGDDEDETVDLGRIDWVGHVALKAGTPLYTRSASDPQPKGKHSDAWCGHMIRETDELGMPRRNSFPATTAPGQEEVAPAQAPAPAQANGKAEAYEYQPEHTPEDNETLSLLHAFEMYCRGHGHAWSKDRLVAHLWERFAVAAKAQPKGTVGACTCPSGDGSLRWPCPLHPPEQWQPMESAPKDGSLLRLLVEFTEHATEDQTEPSPTIGSNSLANTGIDEWLFAGWCWTHDRFVQGEGKPVGWLPMVGVEPRPKRSELPQLPEAFLGTQTVADGCIKVYSAGQLRDYALAALAAVQAPAPAPELNGAPPESVVPRLEWCAATLRDVADRGRAGLGDSYPLILSVLGAVKAVLEVYAATPAPAVPHGKEQP